MKPKVDDKFGRFLRPGRRQATPGRSPARSPDQGSSRRGKSADQGSRKASESMQNSLERGFTSPIKNPFLIQKKETKKKTQKNRKNLKNVKSFDDRLKRKAPKKRKQSADVQNQFLTSIENNLSEADKGKKSGSSHETGILRHKSWKKVRRSAYSLAFKEKRSKLDNSENSTIDSLKLNNKFNRSANSNQETKTEIGADTGRVDQFKNPIIRGKKRHKVSFARKSQTILVENWKELNLKMTIKVNKNKGCLICTLF